MTLLLAQDTATVVSKKKKLPRGYKMFSLFLIPSSDWKMKTEELAKLRTVFTDFGDAIGNEKVAIWFTNDNGEGVDFNRGKSYCDKFGLSYNDGPFIVTSKLYPDEVRKGDELVVIKLGGISIDRVTPILNILEQDLRTERQLRRRALEFEEVKERILTVKDRHGPELKDLATLILKLK